MVSMRLTITIDYDGDTPGPAIDWLAKREQELGDFVVEVLPGVVYKSEYEQRKEERA